jgi:hypothetical protein
MLEQVPARRKSGFSPNVERQQRRLNVLAIMGLIKKPVRWLPKMWPTGHAAIKGTNIPHRTDSERTGWQGR